MSGEDRRMGGKHRADTMGAACSLACGVHCMALPILFAITPASRFVDWLSNPLIHQFAAVLSAVFVAWAIWPNWLKFRDKTVVLTAGFGLVLLATAAFILPEACCDSQAGPRGIGSLAILNSLHSFVAPIGGSMILLAHLFNMQLTRRGCAKC